jgi:phage terminase small subunit
MADLENRGWEAFAQGRAQGLNMTKAYEAAGYKFNRSAASRLNNKPAVSKRLEELLIQREALREARLEETIVALVSMARDADPKNGVSLKEARTARLEAHRLSGLLAQQREAEAYEPPRGLSDEAWEARYGCNAHAATA